MSSLRGSAFWLAALAASGAGCGRQLEDGPSEPKAPPTHALLAPSLRRLSVAELERGAEAVVTTKLELSRALPPDARQNDFSRSLTQSVDALTLTKLYDVSKDAAEKLDLASAAFPSCAARATPADATCAEQVTRTLATRAFRRQPTKAELASLRALFDAAAHDATFQDGAALLVRALLGGPQFLYESALGSAASTDAGETFLLTDAELASQLAWLVSGGPPDDELIAVAAAGQLRSAAEREPQMWRLLTHSDARELYRRFVEEWLGISRLRGLAKSTTVAPDFTRLREAMLQETEAFVDEVVASRHGSLAALLSGSFSSVPAELSELYGIETPAAGQRVSLGNLGRIGILQHASFLATFAHEAESAPVLRGKAVLERLLCRRLPKPAELGINVVLPAPDAATTTRERFQQHAADPLCRQCHDVIDGIGFSFENFDAVGRLRASEAGKSIDTTGHLVLDGQELALSDSAELSRALAQSKDLADCAARQVVRFAAGQESPAVEDDFVASVHDLPSSERGSLLGLMLAYVKSDWFAKRSAP